MLQVRPDATSSPLPFPASKEYALQFVEHLIWRLEHFPSYQLVVTALPLPLYLMTYEIEFPEMTEFYSLCGRHSQGRSSERDFLSDVSTYIVNDRIITELLREYTIRWIIRQPDTTSDRGKVIQFLSKLLTP